MKRNILLAIAMVLGVAYVAYSIVYWGGAATADSGSTASDAGAAIATMLVMPHLVCPRLCQSFSALLYLL
ncbi:MAG: hypothetical protein IJI12_08265 [Atopobiaceae bacterium]|nr:hypothetical protein [Atopobiaceae bacterium]